MIYMIYAYAIAMIGKLPTENECIIKAIPFLYILKYYQYSI